MKFPKIKIENFLIITSAELTLSDRGLVLIQGVNADDTSAQSNGAGKSSLADALCWALYGETARGVSGDDVINDTAKKGTLVQVDIEDGPDRYQVTRHRKHPKGKNALHALQIQQDGTTKDLTQGTDKLTQEVVLKIIGASHDVFTGAIYAGQEKMPDLPAMTDKQLKILIEEASGVTLLEEAYKESRERLAARKSDLDVVQQSHARGVAQVVYIQDQIVQTTAQRDAWVVNQSTQTSANKVEIAARVAAVKKIAAQIEAIDETALLAGLADCDQKLASVSEEGKKLQALTAKSVQAAGVERTLTATIQGHTAGIKAAQEKLREVQHKIGCPCDECGRELTANELEAATNAAKSRLDDLVKRARELGSELEIARKSAAEAADELRACQSTMTDTSQISAQRASLQQQINDRGLLVVERDKRATHARTLAEAMKAQMAAENPHIATLQRLEASLKDAEKVVADLDVKVLENTGLVEIAESVVKVFAPAGVRAHILDDVTPFLNQQTAKYLTTLSDGNIEATWTTLVKNAKGELREKFSIEVAKRNCSKSFAGLSGGEKRKVRIAAALALQDLVATRASKAIDLFIGDEIDDALDPAGLERLMQVLEDKAKERGTVFVISHNSLRDWISSVVTVEMKNGMTTVSEAIS